VPAADSGQPMPAMAREPGRGAGPRQRPWPVEQDYGRRGASGPAAPSATWPGEMPPASEPQPGGAHPGNGGATGSWQEIVRASQENLVVERRRYEAMIYELGKLKVWQEICKQERRENKSLYVKLEAQLAREVDYLRQLLKINV
jgi:hypothetical protein